MLHKKMKLKSDTNKSVPQNIFKNIKTFHRNVKNVLDVSSIKSTYLTNIKYLRERYGSNGLFINTFVKTTSNLDTNNCTLSNMNKEDESVNHALSERLNSNNDDKVLFSKYAVETANKNCVQESYNQVNYFSTDSVKTEENDDFYVNLICHNTNNKKGDTNRDELIINENKIENDRKINISNFIEKKQLTESLYDDLYETNNDNIKKNTKNQLSENIYDDLYNTSKHIYNDIYDNNTLPDPSNTNIDFDEIYSNTNKPNCIVPEIDNNCYSSLYDNIDLAYHFSPYQPQNSTSALYLNNNKIVKDEIIAENKSFENSTRLNLSNKKDDDNKEGKEYVLPNFLVKSNNESFTIPYCKDEDLIINCVENKELFLPKLNNIQLNAINNISVKNSLKTKIINDDLRNEVDVKRVKHSISLDDNESKTNKIDDNKLVGYKTRETPFQGIINKTSSCENKHLKRINSGKNIFDNKKEYNKAIKVSKNESKTILATESSSSTHNEPQQLNNNRNYRTQLCKYYLSQSCTRGDDCCYSHELNKFPCRSFHLKKNCQKKECPFSHGKADEDQLQRLRDEDEAKENKKIKFISPLNWFDD